MVWIVPEVSSFYVGALPCPIFSLEWLRSFPGLGCIVPQLFASRGNRSYPEFWAITGGPRYLG
jgi:hypothetical protein